MWSIWNLQSYIHLIIFVGGELPCESCPSLKIYFEWFKIFKVLCWMFKYFDFQSDFKLLIMTINRHLMDSPYRNHKCIKLLFYGLDSNAFAITEPIPLVGTSWNGNRKVTEIVFFHGRQNILWCLYLVKHFPTELATVWLK